MQFSSLNYQTYFVFFIGYASITTSLSYRTYQYHCINEYNTKTNVKNPARELIDADYYPKKKIYNIGYSIEFKCPGATYMKNLEVRDPNHGMWKSISLHCKIDGTWSGHWPYCQARLCSTPFVKNGNYTITEPMGRTILAVGTKIRYSCRNGYYIDGVDGNECSKDGSWKNTQPDCVLLNVFKNRCKIRGMKYHLITDAKKSPGKVVKVTCTKEDKVVDDAQLNTITIVTSCAAAIFGILLLIVGIVAFQRRRILHQMRLAQLMEYEEELIHTDFYTDEPIVQFKLPSYDEAVRTKPDHAPPTFDESMQLTSTSQETSTLSEEDQQCNSGHSSRSINDQLPLYEVDEGEDIVIESPSVNNGEIAAPPPYPGHSNNRLTVISSVSSDEQCDDDQTQLI